LIAWDYVGPDVENDDVKQAMRERRKAMAMPFRRVRWRSTSANNIKDVENRSAENAAIQICEKKRLEEPTPQPIHRKQVMFADDATTVVPTEGPSSPVCSPPPTDGGILSRATSLDRTVTVSALGTTAPRRSDFDSKDSTQILPTNSYPNRRSTSLSSSNDSGLHRRFALWRTVKNFLHSLFTPASIAIFISFPIALIPKVKALFVVVPGTYMPSAPDGQPPLAFVMDATNFVGAASVPLGLICLGSSLARLPIPKKGEWRTLPLGAISWLAVGRMLLMPVIGVVICEGLTNAGIIPKDDKVLRFVCMYVDSISRPSAFLTLSFIHVDFSRVFLPLRLKWAFNKFNTN